nr:MarR family winged helix-turn-helix transcriptional regulator [Aequitasia blattaphilus]
MSRVGIKQGQAWVLFALHRFGELSQKELAQKVHITPPSMTVAVKKMEEMGLVKKEIDEKDKRIIRICITEQGEKVVKRSMCITDEIDQILLEDMTEEEKQEFHALLHRAMRSVEKNSNMKEHNHMFFSHHGETI